MSKSLNFMIIKSWSFSRIKFKNYEGKTKFHKNKLVKLWETIPHCKRIKYFLNICKKKKVV